jgi:uncharacterized membrane protein
LPDDVLGLPLHPLVVHAVVVLVPLAAMGAIAISVVPRWRSGYGWLVLAVATVAFACVPVATSAGETLKDGLQLGGPAAEKVQSHQDLGERMLPVVGIFWLALAALMVAHRRGVRGRTATVLAALTVLTAAAAAVLTVLTGHSGSEAVWNPGG